MKSKTGIILMLAGGAAIIFSFTDKMLGGDDWNLTLFTCSLSGYERVTVRCIQAD